MTFWIFAAVLTFIAALCVLWPLSRRPQQNIGAMEFDKAVYKARIKEIEKDEEFGRISTDAAKAAKADEARKLIALSNETGSETASNGKASWVVKIAAVAGLIAMPAGTLAAYLQFGSPNLPDQTLASRLSVAPEDQPLVELISRAEAHLASNPEDARGWSVLAPVYARMGRNEEAMRAWGNVLRLAPETPEVKANLGEAIVAASEGVVTSQAQKLFVAELKENQASAKARFYLALGLAQEGRHEEAVKAWQELIRGGTDASPWMAAARSFLAESAKEAKIELAEVTPQAPGPTAEQIEAASEMSSADRSNMILSMVAGLAQKLDDDPTDKSAWQRLIRAYMVLGRKEDALNAINKAKASHMDDQEFIASLERAKAAIQ